MAGGPREAVRAEAHIGANAASTHTAARTRRSVAPSALVAWLALTLVRASTPASVKAGQGAAGMLAPVPKEAWFAGAATAADAHAAVMASPAAGGGAGGAGRPCAVRLA